ncbi:MAG: non-homologous end-joining DNA ligase [Acidobacteriia bacterium]|nr:non-homologous end-joining DNA ligase [Terriglobia bacterium]
MRVSNPDKVFWPDEGYTKLDLARYYAAVFGKLEPYVSGRMLTMERCPDGMLGECFYQKQAPKGLPAATPTQIIRHANRNVRYIVGGALETQLELVNLGCIAVHVWSSRAAHPRQPDWMVFDLDPGSGEFADAAEAGLLVKEALDQLDLTSFPKTSGSRGLHVFVPIVVGPDCDDVLAFAKAVCERVAAAHPSVVTVEPRIEARGDRVYLDPFRNSFGATVAAPYSVRRRAKAPFSMPLLWPEVKPTLVPSDYNLGNYEKRLAGHDPWEDFFHSRQSIEKASRVLQRI